MTNYRTSAGAGGLLHEPMPENYHMPYPIVYQSANDPLTRKREFKALLSAIARVLHSAATTKAEKSVCQEVMRGRSLSIDGLEVLCGLAAKSDRPFVLEEGIRGAVLQRITTPSSTSPIETFMDETRAQAHADVAQALFIAERLPVRRDQALDALSLHEHTIKRAKDALHLWPRR